MSFNLFSLCTEWLVIKVRGKTSLFGLKAEFVLISWIQITRFRKNWEDCAFCYINSHLLFCYDSFLFTFYFSTSCWSCVSCFNNGFAFCLYWKRGDCLRHLKLLLDCNCLIATDRVLVGLRCVFETCKFENALINSKKCCLPKGAMSCQYNPIWLKKDKLVVSVLSWKVKTLFSG